MLVLDDDSKEIKTNERGKALPWIPTNYYHSCKLKGSLIGQKVPLVVSRFYGFDCIKLKFNNDPELLLWSYKKMCFLLKNIIFIGGKQNITFCYSGTIQERMYSLIEIIPDPPRTVWNNALYGSLSNQSL